MARTPTTKLRGGKPKVQQAFDLMKLPSEIRKMIYEQMFPSDNFNLYAIKGSLHKGENAHHTAGEYVAILATCRAVYDEGKPILYNSTEFCIHIQDEYWLHLWSPQNYTRTFGQAPWSAPDADAWVEDNPWLRDPRSVVPVDNVRKLSLDIRCPKSELSLWWTWTAQLRHTLMGARKIARLHIKLRASQYGIDVHQYETDQVLDNLGQTVRCGGNVTAEMELSLGSRGFQSESYWKMLAGYKGLDETYKTFLARHKELSSERAKGLTNLRTWTRSLRSGTEGCIKFAEGLTNWINYDHDASVFRRSQNKVKNTLAQISGVQAELQEVEQNIASLKRNLTALKGAGYEGPLWKGSGMRDQAENTWEDFIVHGMEV